jgi:2-polyprenyl-3-methyl-5-hydroxy-6-metoxy-1,4-benzoquinol methylase
MPLFSLLRHVWRALPGRSRLSGLPLIHALRRRAHALAGNDELYDRAYYENIDALAAGSMEVIAAGLVREAAPASVLDVGCGSGALLAALRDRGVPGVGVEQSAAGLAACRARGLQVHAVDLRADPRPRGRFGAVTCLEVAEHLPPEQVDALVGFLSAASDVVLFTAATPGQGGTGHLNEQPHAYWIDRFAARGLALDAEATARLRREWQALAVGWWYARNVMLFRRARSGAAPAGV